MANYETLKSSIQQVVRANGNQEITGDILQQVLLAMVNSLGDGYQFAGIATPSTNPGVPDQRVFYIAAEPGYYSNFGGTQVVATVKVLKYDAAWTAIDTRVPNMQGTQALTSFIVTATDDGDQIVIDRDVEQIEDMVDNGLRVVLNYGASQYGFVAIGRRGPTTKTAIFSRVYDYTGENPELETVIIVDDVCTIYTDELAKMSLVGVLSHLQTEYKADLVGAINELASEVQKKDWFYYIYGDNTAFSSNSVYIRTLGIFKKNYTIWQNIGINDTFTCNANENIVLQTDGTISIKTSDMVDSSDVVLLTHSNVNHDWIGGKLFGQYQQSLIGIINNNIFVCSQSGITYHNDHVELNNGRLWCVDIYAHSWKSTNATTQDYYFSTLTTSFFVWDTDNNTLSIRNEVIDIKKTDIILLEHSVGRGIIGGNLYADYVNSIATERISVIKDKFEHNVLKSATTVVGGIGNADGIYNNSYGSILLMPVTKGQSIILTTQTGKPIVYALLADNVLVNGQRVNYAPGYDRNIITESNVTVVVDITDGANYLYCLNVASTQVNYAPSSAVIKGVTMYGERVHLSEEYKKIFRENIGVDNIAASVINTSVILRQGGYDNNLTFINNDEYRVSTNPIRDGKLFETYDDYRIEKAILLDSDLNVVDSINNVYLSENTSFAFPSVADRKSWGTDNLLEGYYIVVSFVKANGGKISPNDTIIKNVYDIHSDDLTPVITDVQQLENAIKRSNQVQNLVFKTKAALPVITDYSAASYKDIPANKTCVGMMYCSSKEYDKYVPTHVSYKTFMSALHNRRSLIYTEIIGGPHVRSAYGIPYHGVSCVTYYGINCNYNVFNVLGIIIPENTSEVPSIDGMQLIYNSASGTEFDLQNLRPLDIIDRNGHSCIISNVYKDKYGKNVVVAFSEANVTWARTSLYTEETFLARLHNGDYNHPATNAYRIYRYSFPNNGAWENIYHRIASIKASYEEYLQNGVYNDDICTFAGDDAKFIEGDIIYLNINRGNYTQCQIFKDDTLLQTINLSNDAEIDLNLTPYNLTDGSYKARLTDGVNYSDYTYWEVYQLNLSINSSKVASFNSARLTPLYFEFQSISGSFDYSIGRNLISEAERESGEKTFTVAFNPSLYLKLFARTPDGYLITKRIVYNA